MNSRSSTERVSATTHSATEFVAASTDQTSHSQVTDPITTVASETFKPSATSPTRKPELKATFHLSEVMQNAANAISKKVTGLIAPLHLHFSLSMVSNNVREKFMESINTAEKEITNEEKLTLLEFLTSYENVKNISFSKSSKKSLLEKFTRLNQEINSLQIPEILINQFKDIIIEMKERDQKDFKKKYISNVLVAKFAHTFPLPENVVKTVCKQIETSEEMEQNCAKLIDKIGFGKSATVSQLVKLQKLLIKLPADEQITSSIDALTTLFLECSNKRVNEIKRDNSAPEERVSMIALWSKHLDNFRLSSNSNVYKNQIRIKEKVQKTLKTALDRALNEIKLNDKSASKPQN
jgi:hypothetical protein